MSLIAVQWDRIAMGRKNKDGISDHFLLRRIQIPPLFLFYSKCNCTGYGYPGVKDLKSMAGAVRDLQA